MPERYIKSDPYPWPYNGDLRPQNTTLVIIDMQTDFCGIGGYVDKMGYDLSLTRAPIEPIKRLLAAMRAKGFHIFHTREGHRPDLTDLPENKRWRSRRIGARMARDRRCRRRSAASASACCRAGRRDRDDAPRGCGRCGNPCRASSSGVV